MLYLGVHHSKLLASLLVGSLSLWFIYGILFGLGINASATNLLTLVEKELILLQVISNVKYSFDSFLLPLSIHFFHCLWKDFTLPVLLTKYLSLPGTGIQNSGLILTPLMPHS